MNEVVKQTRGRGGGGDVDICMMYKSKQEKVVPRSDDGSQEREALR